MDLEVEYTTAKQVEGLKGLGTFSADNLYRSRMYEMVLYAAHINNFFVLDIQKSFLLSMCN